MLTEGGRISLTGNSSLSSLGEFDLFGVSARFLLLSSFSLWICADRFERSPPVTGCFFFFSPSELFLLPFICVEEPATALPNALEYLSCHANLMAASFSMLSSQKFCCCVSIVTGIVTYRGLVVKCCCCCSEDKLSFSQTFADCRHGNAVS